MKRLSDLNVETHLSRNKFPSRTNYDHKDLKPVYGVNFNYTTKPYYDPYDSHIHRWKHGLLDVIQDHRESEIKTKNDYLFHDKTKKVEYCEICHEINVNSLKISQTYGTYIKNIDRIFDSTDSRDYIDNNLSICRELI